MPLSTVSEWILANQGGDECIEPDCARKPDGYIRMRAKNKLWQANRWALVQKTNENPPDMEAAHTCGNRACVNMKHLYWASKSKNELDKIEHGTSYVTKLTREQVIAIREDTRSQRAIAADYGLTQANVSRIKLRKTWKHI